MKTIKEFLPEGKFGDFLAKAQGRDSHDRLSNVVDGKNPIVQAQSGPQRKPAALKHITKHLSASTHKKALKALAATGEWKAVGIVYKLVDMSSSDQRRLLKKSHDEDDF